MNQHSAKLFEDKIHSAEYARYRVAAPPAVLEPVIAYVKEKVSSLEFAIDVGCGSGQSTRMLAPFFHRILGCDYSQTQIGQAVQMENPPNISYKVAPAEELPVPDSSVQLVLCQNSVHWFNLEKFFEEVNRILVPGGVVAMSSHVHKRLSDSGHQQQLEEILTELYDVTLHSLWPDVINLQERYYEDIQVPYADCVRKRGIVTLTPSTVADFCGHLNTVSAIQVLRSKDSSSADQLIQETQMKLLMALNSTAPADETAVTIKSEYFVVMGSKP